MSSFAFSAANAFDALCYGSPHPSTVNYLQNKTNSFVDTLTDKGRQFMDRSRQAFEFFNSSAAMEFARNVVKNVVGVFESDHVVRLWEVQAMQKASLTMQRWIMANPNVRKMYHAQKLDGYSDTYSDVHGCVSGQEHYDYRRAMDGLGVFDSDDDFKFVCYMDPLIEGDKDLLFSEQMDIQHTWNKMDLLLALSKDDPTNRLGGTL